MLRFAFPAFAAVMLLLPALPVPDFWITQSIYIGLYSMVALGLVLLTGVAGLTSFAASVRTRRPSWPPRWACRPGSRC